MKKIFNVANRPNLEQIIPIKNLFNIPAGTLAGIAVVQSLSFTFISHSLIESVCPFIFFKTTFSVNAENSTMRMMLPPILTGYEHHFTFTEH